MNKKKRPPCFPDGIVTIYARNPAKGDGDLPDLPAISRGVVSDATKRCVLRFREKKVGITRYYEALHEDILVARVVQTLFNPSVSRLDAAVIGEEMYSIRQIQRSEDVDPPVMDLTLERIDAV